MPLYEVAGEDLVPFRQLVGGSQLYEAEIETLLWSNLTELTGQLLLPLRRQPTIPGGGRPDIVALDRSGSVVVIEVKRDVDRSQLAQCLEYAGWALSTNLDELAGLYFAGEQQFWTDWQQFTDTAEPVRISRSPRLILVARDFDGRTESAFEFLRSNSLPIVVLRVAIYEDVQGRRFLDLEGVDEGETVQVAAPSPSTAPAVTSSRTVHQVTIADLIGAGLLAAGDQLAWERKRSGVVHTCAITVDGRFELPDGKIYGSPSGAAVAAAGGGSFDGWEAWRTSNHEKALLATLRNRYLAADLEPLLRLED